MALHLPEEHPSNPAHSWTQQEQVSTSSQWRNTSLWGQRPNIKVNRCAPVINLRGDWHTAPHSYPTCQIAIVEFDRRETFRLCLHPLTLNISSLSLWNVLMGHAWSSNMSFPMNQGIFFLFPSHTPATLLAVKLFTLVAYCSRLGA